MNIRNTSKVRLKIEGFGYVDPGDEITVPDVVGKELTTGSNFKAVRTEKKKKGPVKGQVAEPAPTDIETETASVDTADNDKGGKEL